MSQKHFPMPRMVPHPGIPAASGSQVPLLRHLYASGEMGSDQGDQEGDHHRAEQAAKKETQVVGRGRRVRTMESSR